MYQTSTQGRERAIPNTRLVRVCPACGALLLVEYSGDYTNYLCIYCSIIYHAGWSGSQLPQAKATKALADVAWAYVDHFDGVFHSIQHIVLCDQIVECEGNGFYE